MSVRDELADVLADTLNKKFKDMKVAYFLDGSDSTPTDITVSYTHLTLPTKRIV